MSTLYICHRIPLLSHMEIRYNTNILSRMKGAIMKEYNRQTIESRIYDGGSML